ncbi:endospore germination permease [Thermoanaerobacterium sp. RBIITD]|uniref:GerAB/ArcD/ProY family transporter n=1 Tax=Thermoanaerobacterium sp. RBIITD TaxID=1550240 RepID=UPI000BB966D7|nr:endospore germination permease [Thermoanaerobacterium sp. RBIITD]SNX54552.1 spore germination protein KB [Thermoanaerobacterium sp. RBIITD]
MKSITIKELFSTMFLFEIGSAILFALGISAKQDAWIAIIIATLAAFPLIYLYLTLFKIYNVNLAKILEATFGKFLGKVLSAIYVIYFLYIAARVTRDFDELSVGSIYPKAPIIAISLTMGIVVLYYLLFDISVTMKSAHLLLPIMLFLIIFKLFASFTTISGINLTKLTPVLENGILPVLKAAFPEILTFPFGELIAFMMIFPEMSNKTGLNKCCFLVVAITGLLLTLNIINTLSTLGIVETERANFPYYQIACLIKFGNFKNLDSFYVVEIIIGGIIKVIVFTYAGIKSIQSIFNLQEYKFLLLPIGTIVFALSIIIADSYPMHIALGLKLTPLYIHVPLQIIIPLIILIISFIKKPQKQQ